MLSGRGAWLNQWAVPSLEQFAARVPDVDYLIIKCHELLRPFALRCGEIGKPWLAEIYPYQDSAASFGETVAAWANLPGCIGVVFNFEDADSDGNWDADNGTLTNLVFDAYLISASPVLPIYACLDTRGARSGDAYQRVCQQRCAGIMPMVYPGAFQQTVSEAFASSINQMMVDAWASKAIMPVLQLYGGIAPSVVTEQLAAASRFPSYSLYTLGRATDDEWAVIVGSTLPPSPVDTEIGVEPLSALMDNIIVPLAFGWTTQVQARLRYLYALAGRPLPEGYPHDV